MVFGTLVKEEQEFENDDPDIEGFKEFDLNKDLDNGDTFVGKPYIGDQYEFTFTDQETGKEITNKQASFWIVNNANKEVLKSRLKVKDITTDEKIFYKKSVGFDLINSIEILDDPSFEGKHNKFDISFKELQTKINSYNSMTVEIVPYKAEINNNLTFWNTVKVMAVIK